VRLGGALLNLGYVEEIKDQREPRKADQKGLGKMRRATKKPGREDAQRADLQHEGPLASGLWAGTGKFFFEHA